MKRFALTGFLLLVTLFILPSRSLALKYDLIPPSGQLQRGQDIQFTINIDTEGASVSSTQIGMDYETQYLQYISLVPGSTMTTVSVSQLNNNKLLFSGSNASGFTGTGVFAYVNFKIIAESPGETELCVLWAPSPTSAPQATSIPASPAPTALPTTGIVKKTTIIATVGAIFLLGSVMLLYAAFNQRYKTTLTDNKKLHRKR